MTERGKEVLASFTENECAIAYFLSHGLLNKQIAWYLRTSEQVIKNRTRSMLDKTGTNDRVNLTLYMLSHGMIE